MSDWRETAEECDRCGAMCVIANVSGWVLASELKESEDELRTVKARLREAERQRPRTAALQVLEAACRDEHGGRHHEPECAICSALKTIDAVDSALPTESKL